MKANAKTSKPQSPRRRRPSETIAGGAWPSYAHGHYARDNAFYQRWDAIARSRDTFTAWLDENVHGTADHAAFLEQLRGLTA